MTAAFAQFLVVLVSDQRAVDIDRDLPAKSLIKPVVFRSRGQVLIAADHMSDPHGMVVHHVREIVGGIAVRLDQDHIIQLCVRNLDLTVDLIHEFCCPFPGNILSDHVGNTLCEVLFDLFLRQRKTMFVVDHDLLIAGLSAQALQSLLRAEAVISLSLFDQLLRIFHIDAGRFAFALDIRTVPAVLVGSLIVL